MHTLWMYQPNYLPLLQDYVDVESPQMLATDRAEYHEAKSLRGSVALKEEHDI